MIGMLVTPIKVQLGPIANGLVTGENFAAAAATEDSGLDRIPESVTARRQRRPVSIRWASPGAVCIRAGQTLAQAVTETKSLVTTRSPPT
jgi:branched-chain amino acid transport system substrate-binding protein